MTTKLRTPTPEGVNRAPALTLAARDDRGAIMVLGIFMCSCIVGALWYVAGIGDAIYYRETMQEASDAVAFSGAVLHARGMNLLVMINLIMACILAIRVVMKVAQVVLVVVAVIVAFIPFIGPTLATLALDGVTGLQNAIDGTRGAINESLVALNNVQGVIAKVVPPASLAGSYQVGERYAPMVDNALAGSPFTVRDGLPVSDGSQDKLCGMAGGAVFKVLEWISPFPSRLTGRVEGPFRDLVEGGSRFFCELGSGAATPPDFSDFINDGAEDGCDEEETTRRRDRDEAVGAYVDACRRLRASCDPRLTVSRQRPRTLTSAEEAELAQLLANRDAAQRKLDDFDHDDCVDEKKEEMREQVDQQIEETQQEAQQNSRRNMKPKMVNEHWHNGIKNAQVVAIAVGNRSLLQRGTKGVRVGSWKTPVEVEEPSSSEYALAQAEFFYDCEGAWSSDECNGPSPEDSNAMWRFRWRARLRRYNAPFFGQTDASGHNLLQTLTAALGGAEALMLAMEHVNVGSSRTLLNTLLLAELTSAAADPRELIIH